MVVTYFVLFWSTAGQTPGMRLSGFEIRATHLENVDLTPPTRARAAPRSRAARAVLDAEAAGDIDVIRFPGATYIVTNDRHPVHLSFPDSSAQLVVRRLDGEAQGPAQTFDAQPGGLALDTTAGKTIEVKPLNRPADGPRPAPAPTAPTDSGPSPGTPPTPTGPAAPGPSPGAPPPSAAADRTPPRVTLSVRRSHGRFLVTVRATDPAGIRRLGYRLTAKGAFHRYRHRLRLTRRQLKALRVRATDKSGNTSKLLAAKVPRR